MDSRGNILSEEEVEELKKIDPRYTKSLAPIPAERLQELQAASRAKRIDWYRSATKAQRKRRNREARARA